jgi:NADH-quinone oxidoreductase subunit M
MLLIPASNARFARSLALGISLVCLILSFAMWTHFDSGKGGMQFSERHSWITKPDSQTYGLASEYYVGVDGLGLLMVLLTAIVTPVAICASWRIEERAPAFFALMLFFQTGLFGTFTALNFFHWFIYWELGLIPAYFLIKMWGGPGRSAAATQFFIYTMVGSVAMLLSFLAIYWATGTFDFITLAEMAHKTGPENLSNLLADRLASLSGLGHSRISLLIFAGVFLGFAVKVPLMPFHSWLPPAYAEAPVGVTMLLTGVMSKMGVYGFLRILLPIFPQQLQQVLPLLLWLAVGTIICSACAAFAQRDLKRMLAYSSINHLGYCLLGIFAALKAVGGDAQYGVEKSAALDGVILQMFNHGLTASLLFCFVGFLEQRSGGSRDIGEFGGLRKVAPIFCGLMGISIFASLGLPGLNGFIGEFLIFKGVFPLATWAAALSVIGLLVTAIFLLTMIQRVFNGPLNAKWAAMPDLSRREKFLVIPATALMFIVGLCPQVIIGKINTTVIAMVDQLKF